MREASVTGTKSRLSAVNTAANTRSATLKYSTSAASGPSEARISSSEAASELRKLFPAAFEEGTSRTRRSNSRSYSSARNRIDCSRSGEAPSRESSSHSMRR